MRKNRDVFFVAKTNANLSLIHRNSFVSYHNHSDKANLGVFLTLFWPIYTYLELTYICSSIYSYIVSKCSKCKIE